MKKLILTFLSENKKDAPTRNYNFNLNQYSGAQTNEAPLKCLLKEMSQKNDEWNVLCIVSPKVFSEKIANNNITQYELYKNIINSYNETELKDLELSINTDYITYKNQQNPNSKELLDQEIGLSIYLQLNGFLLKHKIEEVYIDYTGGFRDTSYQMVSIIQYMETRGIRCKKIIYANFLENKILDLDNTYQLGQLISGIREFINTGNAVSISKFFEQQKEIPKQVNKVLDNINSYTFAMSVINIDKIEQARNNLQNSLRKLENEQYFSNLYAEMFKALSPIIREKMLLDGEINYPRMIQWCLDNRLIQQAVTLYIEKMPVYYYATESLLNKLVPLKDVKENKHETKEYHGFYTDFYDKLKSLDKQESSEKKQELDSLSKFKQLLIDNMPQTNVNQSELESVQKWKNRVEYNFIKQSFMGAFTNLYSLINKHYNSNGKCNYNIQFIEIYDAKFQAPKNYIGFLKTIISNLKIQHYCVFKKNNIDIKKDKESEIYTKKASILESIKTLNPEVFSNQEEAKRIAKILYTYLCVKMIRNRLNHAIEEEVNDDEINAKRILKKFVWKDNNPFIPNLEIDLIYKHIKTIIEFGLSLCNN